MICWTRFLVSSVSESNFKNKLLLIHAASCMQTGAGGDDCSDSIGRITAFCLKVSYGQISSSAKYLLEAIRTTHRLIKLVGCAYR